MEIIEELEYHMRDENERLNEIIGLIRSYKFAKFTEDKEAEGSTKEEMRFMMIEFLYNST